MRFLLSFVVVFLLCACSAPVTERPSASREEIKAELETQYEMALKQDLEEEWRFRDVAFPILLHNAALCPRAEYKSGATLGNIYRFDKKKRNAATALYGHDEVMQVIHVAPNSPSDISGLKSGDKVLAVNNEAVPHGKSAYKFKYNLKIDDARDMRYANYTVRRNDVQMDIRVNYALSCDYGLVYQPQKTIVNAFASGRAIYMARGMMRFAADDDELALIIAHELAHNTMAHVQKGSNNIALGQAGGIVADLALAVLGVNTYGFFEERGAYMGSMHFSPDFEAEADYVGMYYLHRAGYPTKGAAHFWRRMAAELQGVDLEFTSTHPSKPERFIKIEKTHHEIQLKITAGEALLPNLKPRGVSTDVSVANASDGYNH